jgi:hypothetical protein
MKWYQALRIVEDSGGDVGIIRICRNLTFYIRCVSCLINIDKH